MRALLEYKNALQIHPKSAKASLGLGKAYLRNEEFSRAFSAFKSALEIDPELDESRVQVAWLFAMSKQGEAALLEVAQIRRPDMYQPKVDLIKARAYMANERFQEARDILLQTGGGQENKDVQTLLSFSFQVLDAPGEMKQAVERWRKLGPEDPSSYIFLARYALDKGQKAEAIEELKRMPDTNQGGANLALLRAQVLERWGFVKEAAGAYESLPQTPENLAALADFWLRSGERGKARPVLEGLLASAPDNIPAAVKLAELMADENNLASALHLLEQTLKLDLKKPDRERVLLAKATLMARQADWEAVKKICNAVLEENQGNMDAHFLLGKVLLGMRNAADAEIHLNQAASARPNDEEAHLLLARSRGLRIGRVIDLALLFLYETVTGGQNVRILPQTRRRREVVFAG